MMAYVTHKKTVNLEKYTTNLLFLVCLGAVLAACTTIIKDKDDTGFEVGGEAPTGQVIRPGPETGQAVLGLLADARAAAKAGQLNTAESQLERALRIEPKNPTLWHYMAKLRLHQGRLQQAAGLAAKSNSLSRGDKNIQTDNWRIIAHARHRLGDVIGAREAQSRVDELQAKSE